MDAPDDRLIQAINLQNAGRTDEAERLFLRLLDEDPRHFVSLYSLALIQLNRGRPHAALPLVERALAVNDGYAQAHAVRGMALQQLERIPEALAAVARAVALDPNSVNLWINSAYLQHLARRHSEALASCDRALQLDADNPRALANRGAVLCEMSRYQEAADTYAHLLRVAPDFDYAPGLLTLARLHCCDWRELPAQRQLIESGIRGGLRVCNPLALMAISDDPALQFDAARIFAQQRYPAQPMAQRWMAPLRRHPRIRVAYISPDFREHPVGHVLAGVIERHDRERFETLGVSIGVDDGSAQARRFRQGFEHFIEAHDKPTGEIVAALRRWEADIAIDLAGYTSDSRTDIFAQRVAPLQVNWLGYPGTTGSAFHDYLLADRQIVPASHQAFYSERVAYLRDAYLPFDADIRLPADTPSRSAAGLPEGAFVFCCFNHDFKISPEMFALWMRLLRAVDGSVLWLMKLREEARNHLCEAAAAHGVDPQRLVFATRVPRIEDHLARYRLADLLLDTAPYNAHSTAADALFAGLPVLTWSGRSFPGRVAGSLLHALGVPELAVDSAERYEQLALELARDRARLQALRRKIADHHSRYPLFDAQRFRRSLEAALGHMWQRWQQGLPPAAFAVDELEAADAPSAAPTAPARQPLRLRIGQGPARDGWQTLAAEPGPGVDQVGAITDLSRYTEHSIDELYLPYSLATVPHAAMIPTLRELRRVLRADGRLLVSVPDFDLLTRLFNQPHLSKDQRFEIMRRLYGRQDSAADFQVIGLNYEFLADYLAAAGFARIDRVRSFGLFQDQSEATLLGHRISLNVVVHPNP